MRTLAGVLPVVTWLLGGLLFLSVTAFLFCIYALQQVHEIRVRTLTASWETTATVVALHSVREAIHTGSDWTTEDEKLLQHHIGVLHKRGVPLEKILAVFQVRAPNEVVH